MANPSSIRRMLITGATGLIGTALGHLLATRGHRVARLVRRPGPGEPDTIGWEPAAGRLDASELEGFDAVIHLAGENIAAWRWTAAKRRRIAGSRIEGTRLLSETLARLRQPPRVLISASAIGYYGDRGGEVLTEASAPGRGFFPELCRAWEAAAAPAAARGIRVAHLRTGLVLTPAGGALKAMLPAFRLGLGGPMGGGRQIVSWIAMDDALGAIAHLLEREDAQGPYNLTSPRPVAQRDFARALGRVLRRPAVLPAPAWALKLALGEMAGPLLLAGARVQPARLIESGYVFRFPGLEDALRHALGRAA